MIQYFTRAEQLFKKKRHINTGPHMLRSLENLKYVLGYGYCTWPLASASLTSGAQPRLRQRDVHCLKQCTLENGGKRQSNEEQVTTHRSLRTQFKVYLKRDLDTPGSCRVLTTISFTQTCQNTFPCPFTSASDSTRDQELLYVVVHQFITHNMLWQAQGVDHPGTFSALRYDGWVLPQHGTAPVQSDEFVTQIEDSKGLSPS